VDEDELVDTGFMIDESKTPARFIFPDGSDVLAPRDLGKRGYFLRHFGPKNHPGLMRVMVRVKRMRNVQQVP
jgi:hypothetical protein